MRRRSRSAVCKEVNSSVKLALAERIHILWRPKLNPHRHSRPSGHTPHPLDYSTLEVTMRMFAGIVLVSLLAAGTVMVSAAGQIPTTASAELKDASGRVVGNALLTAVGEGAVRVQGSV